MLFDINYNSIFFDPLPRVMKIKTKKTQMRPNIKAFNSKGNHEQQNQMATHRMRENICKQIDQQRINLQNIQIAKVSQSVQSLSRVRLFATP